MSGLLLLLLLAPQGEPRPTPACPVGRLPADVDPPVIDGRVDDAAWQHAAPLGPLTQVIPVAGARPSESTDVRLMVSDEALYLRLLTRPA